MNQEWRDDANCAKIPPQQADAIFFPDQKISRTSLAKAQIICRPCPVIHQCLTWALEHEHYGYWAGTSEDQRQEIRRKQRRAAGLNPYIGLKHNSNQKLWGN